MRRKRFVLEEHDAFILAFVAGNFDHDHSMSFG
jgi:hypothetical protein